MNKWTENITKCRVENRIAREDAENVWAAAASAKSDQNVADWIELKIKRGKRGVWAISAAAQLVKNPHTKMYDIF